MSITWSDRQRLARMYELRSAMENWGSSAWVAGHIADGVAIGLGVWCLLYWGAGNCCSLSTMVRR